MPQVETLAIQRFLEQIKRAAQTRSRDVRIEIADATILAAEIGSLMSRLLHAETPRPLAQTMHSVTVDGGSL